MDLIATAQLWLVALVLTVPRIIVMLNVIPFLSETVLPMTVRNSVAVVLALVVVPLTAAQLSGPAYSLSSVLLLLAKEALLGLMLGYLFSVLYWAVSAMGYLIDMQRGSMSANLFTPVGGSESSPLAAFFSQVLITLVFVGGGFLMMLDGLFFSYVTWPVTEFYPQFNSAVAAFFLKQLDVLFYYMVLLAAPAMIIMFLTEVGMALIGRILPQLNVFLLAMPVKSALVIFLLVLYTAFLVRFLRDDFQRFRALLQSLDGMLR